MARITHVKAARKQYACDYCRLPIMPSDPYKHVSPRPGPFTRGRTRRRHASCPTWTPGELSFSRMAPILDAQREWDISACETVEDVQEKARAFADVVNEVAVGYEESAENMESGFGHATGISDDLKQKANDLQAWGDSILSEAIPEPDEDDYPVFCPDCDGTGDCLQCYTHGPLSVAGVVGTENCANCGTKGGKCPTCEGTGLAAGEVDMDAWREGIEQTLGEMVQSCPV
jgi:hypothetical protein